MTEINSVMKIGKAAAEFGDIRALPPDVVGRITDHLSAGDTLALHFAVNRGPNGYLQPELPVRLASRHLTRLLQHERRVPPMLIGVAKPLTLDEQILFAAAGSPGREMRYLDICNHIRRQPGDERGHALLAFMAEARNPASLLLLCSTLTGDLDFRCLAAPLRGFIINQFARRVPVSAQMIERALPRLNRQGIPLAAGAGPAAEHIERAHFRTVYDILDAQLRRFPPNATRAEAARSLLENYCESVNDASVMQRARKAVLRLYLAANTMSATVCKKSALQLGMDAARSPADGRTRFAHAVIEQVLTENAREMPAVLDDVVIGMREYLQSGQLPVVNHDVARVIDLMRRHPAVKQSERDKLALAFIGSVVRLRVPDEIGSLANQALNDLMADERTADSVVYEAALEIFQAEYPPVLSPAEAAVTFASITRLMRRPLPPDTATGERAAALSLMDKFHEDCLWGRMPHLSVAQQYAQITANFSHADLSNSERDCLYRAALTWIRPIERTKPLVSAVVQHILRDIEKPQYAALHQLPSFALILAEAPLLSPAAIQDILYAAVRRMAALPSADGEFGRFAESFANALRLNLCETAFSEELAKAAEDLTWSSPALQMRVRETIRAAAAATAKSGRLQ